MLGSAAAAAAKRDVRLPLPEQTEAADRGLQQRGARGERGDGEQVDPAPWAVPRRPRNRCRARDVIVRTALTAVRRR